MKYPLVALVVLLGGCGARDQLQAPWADSQDPDDGGAKTDAATDAGQDAGTDGGIHTCSVSWEQCVPQPAALNVSGGTGGQSPDLTWAGQHLLVIYEASSNWVAAVDLDGTILFKEKVWGVQGPRIAFHPSLGTGLAVVDSGLRWLDSQGKPMGEYVEVDIPGSGLRGDVAPTASGFVLLSGTNGYSTPPPLYTAHVGPTPESPAWQLVADTAPRSIPEIATAPDGLARYAASTVWYMPIGELYEIDANGSLSLVQSFGEMLPGNATGFVVGLAEHQGQMILLFADAPGPTINTWSQWIVNLDTAETWRIDQSSNGSDGHLLDLAGSLVVASSTIHPEHRVSVATFDQSTGSLTPLIVLGQQPVYSHSARLAPTPRGFAVAWFEGGEAWLQLFDCCGDD